MSRMRQVGLVLALLAVLAAIVAPFISAQLAAYRHSVRLLLKNRPAKIRAHNAFTSHEIVFADQIRNCEDHILDEEAGIVYLSCDPGRDKWNTVLGIFKDAWWKPGAIYYYEYAGHQPDEPGQVHQLDISGWNQGARKQFHPLGIGRKGNSRNMFITNHSPDGPSVEHFRLSVDGKSAEHVQTIHHELLHAPNTVTAISDTELLISNDHYFTPKYKKLYSKLETYLAPPLGTVVHYDLKTGKAKVVIRQAYPNGIAVLNNTHLAVAATSQATVNIYAMDIRRQKYKLKQRIRVPFFVDNLHTDSAGTLLMAGHPHPRPLDKLARKNRKFNLDNDPVTRKPRSLKHRPRSGSWVAEWDGNGAGRITELYVGNEYDSSSSASRDNARGVGFITGLYGLGIIMYRV